MSNLPVSVIVPHLMSRDEFFGAYCYPSIRANKPAEIFIYDGPEGNQWKRNQGAAMSSQEFLFFCDDDVILCDGLLAAMVDAIGDNDFAYCDYLAANHPTPGFLRHTARPFDLAALRRQNYVSTMSLVRKSAFPGFDEEINRLQDWDMFLTMTDNGSKGVYVEGVSFIAFWLDQGITGRDDWNSSREQIMRKHGL